MILLADGGSTKVDWRLIDNGREVWRTNTKGANPFFRTREDISLELKNELLPLLTGYPIEAVRFFGAGCANAEVNEIIRLAIADHFPQAVIEVDSDLVAAARGLCGKEKGIACILGTGSNSCYYNGENIEKQVSPLGYILGDEGSGAVLGRLFLGACMKNQLTAGLKEAFLEEYHLTPAIILDKVYKQPLPNRFLAGLSPFIASRLGDSSVYDLVRNAFRDFFIRNVMQYEYQSNPVYLTGSVAYHYRDVICDAAASLGIEIASVTASPMEGLIHYYAA